MVTNTTLNIALQNQSTCDTVYAYITGLALDHNNAWFILQADGQTPYYPESPDSTGAALAVDCGIPLGESGCTRTLTIPRIAGGRIWFCLNDKLTFLLNPGPGLVEPSVSNPSDSNYSKDWGFCEFTFNDFQLYANISYVDFVSIPIALSLQSASGEIQHISGIPTDGLETICSSLIAQNRIDSVGWDQLIVRNPSGQPLRVLSPNTAGVMNPTLFTSYYDDYVSEVWSKYSTQCLRIDTQGQWGVVEGNVTNDLLEFPGIGTFNRPSTAHIFSCSNGPFAASHANTIAMGGLTARIAAAFNRSTLLLGDHQPCSNVQAYYSTNPTNYYSKIVHSANLDKLGYAFPYDDVTPTDGANQSGSVWDGSPQLFTVAVGGLNAYT
ncbi:Glycoside hydrolase family 64 protein [Venustampulla echinocandica]|uniref:Glycoside hydrolase family 64 protein n=1 Tax=Venustampulla echinocandica TaxID=2656787 RepID=A0A370TF62_9HELO|nr:Glycoside hydrolase family 64 protein [Venustampulla echinocandica]RDL33319.1 Glycoside hydrolase family 64 protein [Venustampulla echinocandica]